MSSVAPSRGGSLSYLALATGVLERSGPIPFADLYRAILEVPDFAPRGKTPRNSLYSLIWRHSRKRKPDFRLYRDDDDLLIVALSSEALDGRGLRR